MAERSSLSLQLFAEELDHVEMIEDDGGSRQVGRRCIQAGTSDMSTAAASTSALGARISLKNRARASAFSDCQPGRSATPLCNAAPFWPEILIWCGVCHPKRSTSSGFQPSVLHRSEFNRMALLLLLRTNYISVLDASCPPLLW